MYFDWTDEAVARLKREWESGASASLIGKILGCGKSAVIGKAHRLNLTSRPHVVKDRRPKFTPELLPQAQRLRDAGKSYEQIALLFGVSPSSLFEWFRKETTGQLRARSKPEPAAKPVVQLVRQPPATPSPPPPLEPVQIAAPASLPPPQEPVSAELPPPAANGRIYARREQISAWCRSKGIRFDGDVYQVNSIRQRMRVPELVLDETMVSMDA